MPRELLCCAGPRPVATTLVGMGGGQRPTLLAFATKMENAKSKFNSPFSKVSRRAAGPGRARARAGGGDLGGTGGARTKPWQLERAARDRRALASDLSRATSTFRESEGGGRPGPHRHTHYTARTGRGNGKR